MRRIYVDQVELLLRCLPHVERETCFAIKGGTALNLFLLAMPRLSVDIDLVYLPLAPRDESLQAISDAMARIAANIEATIPLCKVDRLSSAEFVASRLVVRLGDAHIKIEPNTVIRGTVHPPAPMDLCGAAQDRFEMFASALVSSRADLYAGKICAALDRQHPRDLFDVRLLLDDDGLDDDIRRAFVVYLASHNRTMHELLAPVRKDIHPAYESSFVGMLDSPPTLEELEATRESLIHAVGTGLAANERQFLLAFKRGEPDWDLLGLPDLDRLPALQWKLLNLRRMNEEKHRQAVAALEKVLGR